MAVEDEVAVTRVLVLANAGLDQRRIAQGRETGAQIVLRSSNALGRRRAVGRSRIESFAARVIGKDVFPRAGEYTGDVIQRSVRAFMRAYSPEQLERATPLLPPPP